MSADGDARAPRGRAGLALGLLVLAAAAAFGIRAALVKGAPEPTLEERLLADDRIAPLIYDCHFGKHFDAQTVDMVQTLVSKLERGSRDALRMARKELAETGEPAVPALRRLFNEVYQDPWKHGVVENVLAVCALMKGPGGLEMIRLGLLHPQESVRLAAVKALREHGTAEDYETVLAVMPMAGSSQTRAEYVDCMIDLDPERFRSDLTTWLEEGQNSDVWTYAILEAARTTEPELVDRLRKAASLRDDALRPFLIAPAARAGDVEALAELHRMLAEGRPADKQLAIQALAAIGRALDGLSLLRDPNAGVRRMAYTRLAEQEPSEEVDAWLQEGMDDGDQEVSQLCLRTLVSRGDVSARNRALQMLEGNPVQRAAAIQVLRTSWDANPGAAEEAFQRLTGLLELASADGHGDRVEILQTLSQVPVRGAAEVLMDLARRGQGAIKGEDTHRFLVGQVWNTGPEGRELLRQELAVETDPFRRLSLIQYVWQDHSDASREVLLALVRDESKDPYERLYAADRVIRIGPASLVAPVIKQMYKANTHAVVRGALQCMLWTWYGQHYE